MTQFFEIHPETPQLRLIKKAVEIIRGGGVVVFPTDSSYALGCQLEDKQAMDKIKHIRQLDDKHHMTLMCQNLSHLGTYAKLHDNSLFRFIKSHTPGPYTFILPATKDVPKRLQHPKRKSIGLRIPDCSITQALLKELDEPLMSCSMIMPQEDYPLPNAQDVRDRLESQVDLIIDGGACGLQETSVIDCLEDEPKIVREGKGDVSELKG